MTKLDSPLRVLIVASDLLTRSGLAALLSTRSDFTLVGHVGSTSELSPALDMYRADVLLFDSTWSDEPLPESVRDLVSGSVPDPSPAVPPLLALASDAEHARALWQAGVRSILLRSIPVDVLAAGLTASAAGLWVHSPELAADIPIVRADGIGADLDPLTEREIQVLQLMAEGLANRAIGRQLDISEHTVKFHVNSILGKLGAQSRTDAVVRATRAGIILI